MCRIWCRYVAIDPVLHSLTCCKECRALESLKRHSGKTAYPEQGEACQLSFSFAMYPSWS